MKGLVWFKISRVIKLLNRLIKWEDPLIQRYCLGDQDKLDKKLGFYKDLEEIINIEEGSVICMKIKIFKIKSQLKCRKKKRQYQNKNDFMIIFYEKTYIIFLVWLAEYII
jgi:hypothetical protein